MWVLKRTFDLNWIVQRLVGCKKCLMGEKVFPNPACLAGLPQVRRGPGFCLSPVLYASELLISRKFCQTSIIYQRKNSFAEVKVDCLCCCFFSDGGVTGV